MKTHTARHPPAGKYEPLTEFLGRQPRDVVRMSFDQIERVIGVKLPPSASRHRAWWSNNAENNVMTRAWRDAGFASEDVDMRNRRVSFRRVRAASPAIPSAGRHPALGWMKGTLTIADGVDLTQPADPEWGRAVTEVDGK